ncbi:MAG: hypothetical protein ABIK09_04060 [Pseudomonadota bacterium]
MKLATVDGSMLTVILVQMAQAPRRLLGSAFWCFGEEIVIRWTSYEQPLAGEVESALPSPLMVPGDVMAQLGAGINLEGAVDIEWEPERARLRIGPYRLPAIPSPEPPFVLPLDAGPRDLLRRLLLSSREAVTAAGYGVEAEEVDVRWRKGLAAATEDLAWTGLTRQDLEAALSEVLTTR